MMPDPSSRPVLVVDDDHVVRAMMEAALQDAGLDVVSAANSAAALAAFDERRPRVVVLDFTLPGASSQQLADALRAKAGRELPIVMVTADGTPQRKANQLRAASFLVKPFEIDDLIRLVEDALRQAP